MKLLTISALLLCTSIGYSSEALVETFEDYTLDAPLPEDGGQNRWSITGYGTGNAPGEVNIITGEGVNDTQVLRTTPQNSGGLPSGTNTSISTSFAEVSGRFRFEVKVFPEMGTGQLLLRFGGGAVKTETAFQVQFRASPGMDILAFARQEGEEVERIPLGKYQFKRWYQVVITGDANQQQCDLEVTDLETGAQVISVAGLDFQHPAPAINNVIVGAIYGVNSAFAWDDFKLEQLP